MLVNVAVHPNDHMFSFMKENLNLTDEVAAFHYSEHGRQCAETFRSIVERYPVREPSTLLEFASGYGCVTRSLLQACPQFKITCSDIHPGAIAHLKKNFPVEAVLSNSVPEHLGIAEQFDAVFVVSLFSHLPDRTFARWLKALSQRVAPDGLLIFSTHGLVSARNFNNPPLDEKGYWFYPLSEQKDIDGSEYGSTITSFKYVNERISALSDFRLLSFAEGGLRQNQDLWTLRRS